MKIKKYYVSYIQGIKATLYIENLEDTYLEIIKSGNLWTEVGWFDYWFYRLFY